MTEIILELMTNGFGQLKSDGSLDLKINVREDQIADAVKYFGKKGQLVYLALGKNQITLESEEHHGNFARELRLSSFLRTPDVWKVLGTDDNYLEYIRSFPCSYCSSSPAESAHVRRVENDSGIGLKPKYSAIPLCHECHQKQHSEGESFFGGREWFDNQRINYIIKWCWDRIK